MSFPKSLLAAIFLVGLIGLCACQHQQEASNLPIKQYQLHGRVVSLNPQDHTATINGQKIEGWMDSMTMQYPVKADSEYQKLRPGEQISATVFVQGMHFWIAGIRPEPAAGK